MTQPEESLRPEGALAPEGEPAALEGPPTPEDDETFGPEPDDPAAAAPFAQAYEVEDFDPALEERDLHEVETTDEELIP